MKKYFWHILFIAAVACLAAFVIYRLANWGTIVDHDYDRDNPNHDFDIEVQDLFFPVLDDSAPVIDDGVTTIVALGNAPFADDRGSRNNLASLIEDRGDTVVYNCAIGDSYLAAQNYTLDPAKAPLDAFNFYWLCTLITLDNVWPAEAALEAMGTKAPEDAEEVINTLKSIDFSTVDVIAIMYDAIDYYMGRPVRNIDNPTDIKTFNGNLAAGIELLQSHFPHIRIIVMSPTYAYAINEEGEYVSSYLYRYAEDSLATYALTMADITSAYGVSFVDNIYGTIHEDIADEYLVNSRQLNKKGRELVADRFIYALEYFD